MAPTITQDTTTENNRSTAPTCPYQSQLEQAQLSDQQSQVHQAMNDIFEGIRTAQSRGAFSLEEASHLLAQMNMIKHSNCPLLQKCPAKAGGGSK